MLESGCTVLSILIYMFVCARAYAFYGHECMCCMSVYAFAYVGLCVHVFVYVYVQVCVHKCILLKRTFCSLVRCIVLFSAFIPRLQYLHNRKLWHYCFSSHFKFKENSNFKSNRVHQL